MTTYQVFTKHAVKLQKKGKNANSRPALQGVYHSPTHVVMTDSHRLMRANIAFPSFENKIIDPKTGQEIEHTYPDTNRLIPDFNEASTKFKLELKPTIDFLKAVKTLKIESVDIIKDDNTSQVHLKASNQNNTINLSLDTQYTIHTDLELTTVNTIYLLDMLEWLKEYGTHAYVYHYSKLRPILVTPEYSGNYEAEGIVLPIRKY